MNGRRWMPWLAAALVASLAVAGAGYGGSSAPTAPEQKKNIKVGVITDIGGLNDRGFNQLANKGRKDADKIAGVSTRILTSDAPADYIPNLGRLARENYDLIIGVGFLMADEVGTVAKQFPKVKFATVDGPYADMGRPGPNALGLVFRESEAGCLVGDLAARYLKSQRSRTQKISAVGGISVPAVNAFIAGYQFCAKKANPRIQVTYGYANSFTDQAKCKELASNQFAGGSQVVFQVAGGCGIGVIQAAKERSGRFAIGVDADQAFYGPHVLTSALKRVDVAVLQTAKLVKAGKFKGGRDRIFSVKDGGVGLGKVSPRVPKRLVQQTLKVQAQLKAGKLRPPRTL